MLMPPTAAQPAASRDLTVQSPDGRLRVSVLTGSRLTWSVTNRGRVILEPSALSMTLDGGRMIGRAPIVTATSTRSGDTTLRPIVRIKRQEIRDRFNERRIDFAGDYSLVVRAYDDGVAYRFETRLPGEITVQREEASFRFPGNHLIYFPEETSFISHQERLYAKLRLNEIKPGRFSGLPALVDAGRGSEAGHHRGRPPRLPRHGHHGRDGRPQPRRLFPAYPTQRGTAPRSERARARARGLPRADARDARLPLARAGGGGAGRGPARDRHRLPAGVGDHAADTSWISPARWRGTGGTRTTLRRAVPRRRQHRRRTSTTSISRPRTGSST